MTEFDSDPVPEPDSGSVPIGATVVAFDGSLLGTVREVHPHFLFVAAAASPGVDLEVPLRAIARVDGDRLHLRVNREALNEVEDTASARRRLQTE